MRFQRILIIVLFLFIHSASALENKVLLIGIDGVQYERLQALETPGIDRLHVQKAYTGGIAGGLSEQKTYSGPGWGTIMTGVWANKHQVFSNSSGLANSRYPSLYRHIRTAYPDAHIASFATWAPIHDQFFTNDLPLMNEYTSGGSDESNFNRAISLLESTTTTPDFVFLHLDRPDVVGHGLCFGPTYDGAIQEADGRVDQLLDRVAERRALGENWLVIVTTDHGRVPNTGCNHGDQTESEKTMFIASSAMMNEEFNSPITEPQNSSFNGIYGFPSQAAITPTILRYMGIELKVSDSFDDIPLLGELGVRKLSADNGVLNWYSTELGLATIYRNGVEVAQSPANLGTWTDTEQVAGELEYVVKLNQAPVAIIDRRIELRAIHGWKTAKSYFFRNDKKYVRYDEVLDRADADYPALITDGNWPGLMAYRNQIQAAFKADDATVYYFLSGGRYISYDLKEDRARDGYPRQVSNLTWPGLGPYAKQIIAALRWTGDKVYFFLDNGQYLRYDLETNRLDEGYPVAMSDENWPGLGAYAGQIIATVKWNSTRAYFFLKDGNYIRYNITFDRADKGYPRPVDEDLWPGLMVP